MIDKIEWRMAEKVVSDGEDSMLSDSVLTQSKRGRPRKDVATVGKAMKTNKDEVEQALASIESKLKASLSKIISDALAPLRSLIADQVKALNTRITDLEEEIDRRFANFDAVVSQHVADLKEQIVHCPVSPSYAAVVAQLPGDTSSSPSSQSGAPVKPSSTHLHYDRKFNVVIFGIKECSKGTHWTSRACQDLNSVSAVISSINDSITKLSIRDCRRLGKYSETSNRPRPILVEFNRSSDVTSILSQRGSLKDNSIIIKPDMSPTEKAIEATLLKERWSLIQSGTDRKAIKIKGSRLYANGRLYGQVIESRFHLYPLVSDVASGLNEHPFNTSSTTCTVKSEVCSAHHTINTPMV